MSWPPGSISAGEAPTGSFRRGISWPCTWEIAYALRLYRLTIISTAKFLSMPLKTEILCQMCQGGTAIFARSPVLVLKFVKKGGETIYGSFYEEKI